MSRYRLRQKVVAKCLAEFLDLRIHPHFGGYLCVKRAVTTGGGRSRLRDFQEFFDTFLAVPDGPPGRPYYRPFYDGGRSVESRWYQGNVPGTYAASSLRPNSPFLEVVLVQGRRKETAYSLKEGHSQLALTHLAHSTRVPVVPLAVFLYRDFDLESDSLPTLNDLIEVFRYEFGYSNGDVEQFNTLYVDDSAGRNSSDWFEKVT